MALSTRCKGICPTSFINSLHVVPVLSILLDGHYLEEGCGLESGAAAAASDSSSSSSSLILLLLPDLRTFQPDQPTTVTKQHPPLTNRMYPQALRKQNNTVLTTYLRYQDINDTLQSIYLLLTSTGLLLYSTHYYGPEGSSTYD